MIILLWIIDLFAFIGDMVTGLYWMVKHPVKSAICLTGLGLLVYYFLW